ncbi:ornithine carbamoyltransferase [Candidatus Margulisiibacteriota bacterium]
MSNTKHFLSVSDYSKAEILEIFKLAGELKELQKNKEEHTKLKGKTLAMIFQKPSNRTRLSFEVGMYQLGGQAVNIREEEIGMGVRESIPDVARTISRYVDAVMIRANKHTDILKLAEFATVPVINGLSDRYHPCQAMADLMTILEYKDSFDGLKLCYIGDGNNVARSLIKICNILGVKIVICSPPGYGPKAEDTMGSEVFSDPYIAAKDADVIYTDVWASMGQENNKEKRLKDFKNYTVNMNIMAQAKRNAIFMHCLPAHRGEEVENEVIESKYSVVFDQAENRMHVQKGILLFLLEDK